MVQHTACRLSLQFLAFLPRQWEVHVGEENVSAVPMEVEGNITPFPVEEGESSQPVDEI